MSRDLERRIARLEHRLANLNPVGRVMERDHEKGVRVNLGTDDKPFLSPWIQPGDRTGASRYLPEVGEQIMVLSHGGDWAQATLLPLTHSNARPNPAEDKDETVHHNRDGERRSVKKGHARHQAKNKISQGAGDGGKKGEGSGKSGANLSHEINRQLQGIRANLTQLENNVAGVFEAASKMREIAEGRIPELKAIKAILDGKPESLEKAAKMALGNLEGYVAKSMQQMLGKLTNGFMNNVLGMVQGFVQGQIAGVLGQIAELADLHGIADLVADPLGAAEGLITEAASGAAHNLLGSHMGAIEAAFAGTPGEAAFAALRGELGGILNGALDVAANLGGMLDAQKNLVKGMSKSLRLGGYEGED